MSYSVIECILNNKPDTVFAVFPLSTYLLGNYLDSIGFLPSASLDTFNSQHDHSGFAFRFDLQQRVSSLLLCEDWRSVIRMRSFREYLTFIDPGEYKRPFT